jgi:hypothetical protein
MDLAETREGGSERQRPQPGIKTDMGESTSVHAVEVLVAPATET